MNTAKSDHRTQNARRLATLLTLSLALSLAALPAAAEGHKSRAKGKDSGKGRVESPKRNDRGSSSVHRAPEPRRDNGKQKGANVGKSRKEQARPEWSDRRTTNDRDRQGSFAWRDQGKRTDRWNDNGPRYHPRRAPVRHYVPYEPRHHWVTERWHPVRKTRPSFVYVGTPYYQHVQMGIYFSNFWFNVAFVDAPPPGCAFYDPYCGATFWSIGSYRGHLHGHSHAAALDVVVVNNDACDPYWEPRPIVLSDGCNY